MHLAIRNVGDGDLDELKRLMLLAFAPIFSSFEQILGPEIYPIIYPDWGARQVEEIEKAYQDTEKTTLVAELNGLVVGLLVYQLHPVDQTGEVQLLAVHPDYQNRGIGTDLNNYALKEMKSSGIKMAVVGTGGDPSHAPARRSYEKSGYTALPLVRYYKDL